MRPPRLHMALAVSCTVLASAAHAADLDSGVRHATSFCLTYLQTGKQSDVLLRNGFRQKPKGFEKRYGRDLLLGHKNNVHVSTRNRRNQPQCLVTVGNGGVKKLNGYVNAAREASLAQGFRPATVTNIRGQKVNVLKKGNAAVRYSGKSSSGFGSISSMLIFERMQ